jgi:putative ABC transport system permease protein
VITMTMPIALRLAIRQWRARPLRPILCALAIAAAVGLIVAVGMSMDSLRRTVSTSIGQMLGVADIHVRPAQRGTESRVPAALLERLRALPDVELANGRLASQAALTKGADHLWFDVVGIAEPLDNRLRPKILQAGRTLSGQPDEILVDTAIAEKMSLHVGDEISYSIKENPPRMLRVVGIVKRPMLELLARPTMFVPLAALTRDLGIGPEYSVLDLTLRQPAGALGAEIDVDAFARQLGDMLGPSVDVTPGTHSKARMADVTRAMRLLLTFLTAVAAFSASLIIGTTLSVGVQERVRQFGQLRCIGASRGQLAVFLLGDALVMLVIGEVLGLPGGVGLAAALSAWFPQFLRESAFSAATLAMAAACGALATALGALIPIWQVSRVSPMAAVTAAARPARRARVLLAGAAGILCLIVQQLLWRLPQSRDVRLYGYFFCGAHLIFIGWCLMAPTFVLAFERVAARPLAGLFGVRASLLRHAWSRTPWRAGAMAVALMIGVTLFVAVRARTQSLQNSWIIPRIPDLVVQSLRGLSASRLEQLRQAHPELRQIVPFQAPLVHTQAGSSILGRLVGDNDITFLAVDVRQFVAQVPLDFSLGNLDAALRELDAGRHVIVTSEFQSVRHLGLGDKITLRGADGQDVVFTISGVVNSTGVEMVKNYFELRSTFGERAFAAVLGTDVDGRKYFKLGDPTMAILNVAPAARTHMSELRSALAAEGIQSLSAVEMKQGIEDIIRRLTNGLTVVALGALCVASLGVTNMVIASIHARRYEFGVLRAIGAGRWQLIRLVLAEVTLIALIAGVLGTCAGLSFAYMITQADHELIGFQEAFINPQLADAALFAVVLLALAVAMTMLLGWLAAIIPAVRGANSAQRTLLAAGRG